MSSRGIGTMRAKQLVETYAGAKSRADVDDALALCTESFELETVAFGLTVRGQGQARMALNEWFTTFPDYEAALDGVIEGDGAVAAWGTLRATMWGDMLGQRAT